MTGLSVSSTVATSPMVRICAGRLAAPGPPPGAEPAVAVGSSGSDSMSCVDDSLVPVLTVNVCPSWVISPPGRRIPFCCKAVRMAVAERPASASFAGSGVMVTRCPTAPTRVASRTPSTLVSSGSTVARTASARPGLVSPVVTANWMIGRSSKDPVTTCGSTPAGRVLLIRLIA